MSTYKYTDIEYFTPEILDLMLIHCLGRNLDIFKIKQFFSEHNLYAKTFTEIKHIEFSTVNLWNELLFNEMISFVNLLCHFSNPRVFETSKMKYFCTDSMNELIIENDLVVKCINPSSCTNYVYNSQNQLIKMYNSTIDLGIAFGDIYYFSYGNSDDNFYISIFNTPKRINNRISRIKYLRKDLSKISYKAHNWTCNYNEYSDCIMDYEMDLNIRRGYSSDRRRKNYPIHIEYNSSGKITRYISKNNTDDIHKIFTYTDNNVFIQTWEYNRTEPYTETTYSYIYDSNGSLAKVLCDGRTVITVPSI